MARYSRTLTTRKTSDLTHWVSLVVILVFLSVITISILHLKSMATDSLDNTVSVDIANTANVVETQMGTYIQALYGSRALISAHPNTTRLEWEKFYLNNGIVKRLPSFGLIAYVRLVPANQKTAFVASVKNDTSLNPNGYPSFSIHPDTPKAEYLVVDYIEPFSLSSLPQSFGFDYSSSPTRKEAYEKARDTNTSIMTNPMKSLDNVNNTVLVIVLPVYDANQAQTTLDQRRNSFRGFTALGIRTQDFFNEVFKDLDKNTAVEVYDGTEISEAHRLYDSNKELKVLGDSTQVRIVTKTHTIPVADRTWTLVFKHAQSVSDLVLIPSFYGRMLALVLTNIICAILVWKLAKRRN